MQFIEMASILTANYV